MLAKHGDGKLCSMFSASSNLRFRATQPNLEVFSTKTLFLFEIKDCQSHLKYQKVVFEGTCTYFFHELLTQYQRLLPVQFFLLFRKSFSLTIWLRKSVLQQVELKGYLL